MDARLSLPGDRTVYFAIVLFGLLVVGGGCNKTYGRLPSERDNPELWALRVAYRQVPVQTSRVPVMVGEN